MDANPRRGPLGYPYLESFGGALALGGPPSLGTGGGVDLDMDEAWKLLGLPSAPQCVGPDHAAHAAAALGTALRSSHDDLCAYPPKCPTTQHPGGHGHGHGYGHAHGHGGYGHTHGYSHGYGYGFGYGGSSASHMLFHTRHADPQATAATAGGLYAANSPSSHSQPCQSQAHHHLPGYFGPLPSCFGDEDGDGDGDADVDADAESTCDSECGFGEICHDTACSDDPSVCCEDEACLQTEATAAATSPRMTSAAAITSEDAIAAAALTSFVEQQKQASQQQEQRQQHQSQEQQEQQPCLQLLGPDMCISPQFLTNYQHLREAHNPLQPAASCTADFCPVEDPSFYQECHIRHLSSLCGGGASGSGMGGGAGLFDNIDINHVMLTCCGHSDDHIQELTHEHSHHHPHDAAAECGAKFPNGEAMVQHLWNEHRNSLSLLQLDPMPGMVSSAPSSVSLPSEDAVRTPASLATAAGPDSGTGPGGTVPNPALLSLPDASLPLAAYNLGCGKDVVDGGGLDNHGDTAMAVSCMSSLSVSSAAVKDEPADVGHTHACLWCDAVGGPPCGQGFAAAADLHRHVLVAHTQPLKRGAGGTYSCGWLGCARRDCEAKGGFVQKSKIDRHMQAHTGNKPFLCDICHQSFSANQALVQHKLIHEDSKPLSCDICGKTFRQHSALTMHIRTHTKVRPLKCPYCNKEFSESSNLSKHKRIHTGDGQFACPFPGCHRTFHRKDQLRRHSTQHTKAPSSAVVKTAAW